MVQVAAEHESEAPPSGEIFDAEAKWRPVLASLTTLEAGLGKVKGDLGRMGRDIEAFRESLEALDGAEGAKDRP